MSLWFGHHMTIIFVKEKEVVQLSRQGGVSLFVRLYQYDIIDFAQYHHLC